MVSLFAGICGVLVGAVLNYWFTRELEDRKRIAAVRDAAYADFIRAVASQDFYEKRGDLQKASEYAALSVDAKARILMYGSQEVVRAMAIFWQQPDLRLDSAKQAFLDACHKMRLDSQNGGEALHELCALLYGNEQRRK
jgi:hypothetical protein